MKNELHNLEKKINLFFKNKDLLKTVFIHRSYLNENKNLRLQSNEKLEFLGDSVLALIVSLYLFKHYPSLTEGDYTDIKAKIVCTESLSQAASKLNLGEYLYLSKGEEKTGGRSNQNLLADCYEALIGAIFLEFGFNKTYQFVLSTLFKKDLNEIITNKLYLPAKSRLQELTQAKLKKPPTYTLVASYGPEHAKKFKVKVGFGEQTWAVATGRSKKDAEEKAATLALKKIKNLL